MKNVSLTCSIKHCKGLIYQHSCTCSNGHPLNLDFVATFKIDQINQNIQGLWRYQHALPIAQGITKVTMNEGFTPMLSIPLEGKSIFIKQDQLFSSGSYKDRGATVLITQALAQGVTHLIQDSSGNAGCAIAAYAAMANIKCSIYLPESTSLAKTKQIAAYGANIIHVAGDRSATADAAFIASKENYYASHVFNPWFLQGTKTIAYEITEQLNWKAPDAVILPAGNGTLILGCYIGFNDLLQSGIIQKMPKIIAVQAANCAPIYHALMHKDLPFEVKETVAEGIAIPYPKRLEQMAERIIKTGGKVLLVNEEEIITAYHECAHRGFYIEPTSAATIAGCKQYLRTSGDEVVVSLFTGHGLKK